MAPPRKSYRLWILGKLLRALLAAVLLTVLILLFWRVFLSGRIPRDMRTLSPTPALTAAYRENGGDLGLFTQGQATITKVADYNYGYFGVPRFVIAEKAREVQVVFRYNNSTLRHIEEDLGLEAPLPRGERVFDVTLLVVSDLTPETAEDNTDGSENLAETRVFATDCRVETTALYTYFYYVFDGVDTSDAATLVVDLDVFYPAADGTVDYTARALGTLRLYHHQSERVPVKLTAREKRALAG